MGLGQSSDKEKDVPPISSKFSSLELTKLEEFFKFKEQVSEQSKRWNHTYIKDRIGACFSPGIGHKIVKYLEGHTIKKEDDGTFVALVLHLTKDCIKDLADIVFRIVAEGNAIVSRDSMKKFLAEFLLCFPRGMPDDVIHFGEDQPSSERLAEMLVEHCPEKMKEGDFDVVLHRTPLLIDVLQYKFRMLFFGYISDVSKRIEDLALCGGDPVTSAWCMVTSELSDSRQSNHRRQYLHYAAGITFAYDVIEESQGAMPYLIPQLEITNKSTSQDTFILSLPSAIYLNSRVPMQIQHKWRLLYSTKLHGESFSKLTGAIIDKGPTLLVIKDTNGYVFGAFASTSWQYSAQFQGTDKCFLFATDPALKVYDCLGGSYNDHYMYLNVGQETMPNGLGMGGQFEFFGLWLDSEFGVGHSKAKPLCTTYKSPQLSKEENFKIDSINVWGIGEEPQKLDNEEYTEEMTSVLDKHVEAKALLEIAGKPRVSEGLRDIEPDADIPGTKELQHAHDPMT